MKYTVEGFNQEKAIEYGLDLTDLLILRWIVDFFPKMSKKNIEGKEFAWIDYKTILEDMPILGFTSKDRLYRKLKEMAKKGILIHKGIKNKEGSFSYYGFGEKYQELVGKDNEPRMLNVDKQRTLTSKTTKPHTLKTTEQNNSSTKINSSIKYIYYGEYKNVFFTEEQYNKLLIEFPSDYQERIQRLDDYMQSTGTKYKDCLATIKVWAKRDKAKQNNKRSNPIEEMNRLLKEEKEKCK